MVNSLIVIGAGHNALVTAFYLARAGYKPLVLERRGVVGGGAVTEEIASGYRCPTLSHSIGPLRPSIVRDMQLARRVEFIEPDPRLIALSPDGRALVFSDRPRTAEAIRAFSDADGARYPEFCEVLERLGRFLAPLLEATPPSLNGAAAGELWDLLKMGRRFRALGRTDGYRLLRWMPMAVADLVGEWFSNDVLQAAIATRALFGSFAGPWSGGTGAALLVSAAADPMPAGNSTIVKGGPGALTAAMAEAAREAGAEIRLDAPVTRVLARDGRVRGVALADGSEMAADVVISNADPKATLLDLVDPAELDPSFRVKIRNYRTPGTVAKVNLALRTLPAFRGIANPADLHGRILVAPGLDYLERAFDCAKYGEISAEPWLDVAIPSLSDPSLAPPGRHVMSVYVQFAPYKLSPGDDWHAARDRLADNVMRTLEHYVPGLGAAADNRQVLTPRDLEEVCGLTGGHVLHGEPALDQSFTMRPVLVWAQYRTPIDHLFLCGAGTHPGGGLTGGSGQNAAREILRALKSGARR
jgi:phytoene dehydrogenase-like protein